MKYENSQSKNKLEYVEGGLLSSRFGHLRGFKGHRQSIIKKIDSNCNEKNLDIDFKAHDIKKNGNYKKYKTIMK